MANTIIITKLENGNVDIVDSTAIDKSRTREGGFATRILDAERVIVEDSGSGKGVETFSYIDVEKVIRADATEVAISDLATLYSELKEFFFFELSGTGGGGGGGDSKVAIIGSGDWIAGGTSGLGSTHHFIYTHDLDTQDLLFEARDTDGDFVRQLNDYYTAGFGITDGDNQVRIETSDNSLNVAVLISNGASSTAIFPNLTYTDNGTSVNKLYENGWNQLNPLGRSSSVSDGTDSQPNRLGKDLFTQRDESDGVQTVFIYNLSFVSDIDATQKKLRLASQRFSDGVYDPLDLTTDYTVTGAGTNTITVTLNSPIPDGDFLWVRIISDAFNTNAFILNFISDGYDNVSDGSGFMSIINGAHNDIANSAGGHNTILGGSFNQIINGCSYSTVGGFRNILIGANFATVAGRGSTVSGDGDTVSGAAHIVDGDYNDVTGLSHRINHDYIKASGRGGQSWINGSSLRCINNSNDIVAGAKQVTEFSLSETTTSATEGFFSQLNGSDSMSFQGRKAVKATFEVIATTDDGVDYASFSADVILKKDTDVSAITILGGTAFNMVNNTAGASTWSIRLQSAGSIFYVRPTGEAAKTIIWVLSAKLVEASFDSKE